MQIIEKRVQIKNILKWACSYSLKIGNKTFLAKSSLRWHARTQPPLMAILEYLCTGQEIRHHSFSPKRVNDDCCQMSLGQKKKKKAQFQANEVCLFLWHFFVRSSLNRDYYNSSILIRAPTTMAPTHHGEKLRKLWGWHVWVFAAFLCQAWVPLEEWQATPFFFFFLLNLLFCSGV